MNDLFGEVFLSVPTGFERNVLEFPHVASSKICTYSFNMHGFLLFQMGDLDVREVATTFCSKERLN